MGRLARDGSKQTLFHLEDVKDWLEDVDWYDAWIRARFDYRPETEEVIRTPQRMWDDFAKTGRFEGDCDDISTFFASILIAMGYSTRFVAIRYDPSHQDFEHVYTEFFDGQSWRVVDPTVEPGTDYQVIERMVYEV
jgi:transglutaminase-like putative cysteine protease